MKNPAFLVTAVIVFGAVIPSIRHAMGDQAVVLDPQKDARPSWSKKMEGLYKTLSNLLTDVESDQRFRDPANRSRIENEASQLAALAHDLNKKGMVSPDPDPTIPFVAGLLAERSKLGAEELKRGNRSYARSVLRSVPSYCIACHTRNASGPQFGQLALEPTSNALTPIERGAFYAATRQFDRAQTAFMGVVQDPVAAQAYSFIWEEAVHQSLAIAVRVKQDSNQAEEIVQAVLNMKNAPPSIQEDAKVWELSIQEWQREGVRHLITEEGFRTEAIRLMAKARETQKYPMDRTGDVFYLRASAAAHDLLQAAPQGASVGEAFLLAGLSYEVLNPLKTDDLHDIYYMACIEKTPHTPIAEVCYRRFEQSIILGFTGSAGTDVPPDTREQLRDLRVLSRPIVQKPQ